MTFIAALRHNRLTAPMLLEGPMTGQSFIAYVDQVLAPTLKHDDVPIMDNVPAQGPGRAGSPAASRRARARVPALQSGP
jgi:transposase